MSIQLSRQLSFVSWALALSAMALTSRAACAKNYNEGRSNTAAGYATDQLPPPGFTWKGVDPAEAYAIPGPSGRAIKNPGVEIAAGYGGLAPVPVGGGQWSLDSLFDVTSLFDFEDAAGNLVRHTGSGVARLVGAGVESGPDVRVFDVELVQLDLSGQLDLDSNAPVVPFLLRESPALTSAGQMIITQLPGGEYEIASSLEIFTEMSVDGGQTWAPAQSVPEPSSLGLAGAFGAALLSLRRKLCKRSLLGGLALVAVVVSSAHAGQTIPGVDIIVKKTPSGKPPKVAFGAGGLPTVPSDFFGPGSLPFEGPLSVEFGPALFRRTAASNFDVANPSTIPTELQQFRLTAATPIEPAPGRSYDVTIDITGPGSMSLREENPAEDGGGHVVQSFFDATYAIEFSPRDATPGGPLSLTGSMQLEFAGNDPADLVPWSYQLPGGGSPAGGGNFVLGSDGSQLVEFRLQSPDGGFSLPMTSAVPEPATLVLAGLCGLLFLCSRRKPLASQCGPKADSSHATVTQPQSRPWGGQQHKYGFSPTSFHARSISHVPHRSSKRGLPAPSQATLAG